MEVIRTSPYRYPAITFDGTNEGAIGVFVTQYPTGSVAYGVDEGIPIVEISKDPIGNITTQTLEEGDTIFKEQGNEFWTVVSDLSTSDDYDTV